MKYYYVIRILGMNVPSRDYLRLESVTVIQEEQLYISNEK